jgi:hypothetical protein
MRQIKLYLDEDVNPLLARDLSQRGYDAVSTSDAAQGFHLMTWAGPIASVFDAPSVFSCPNYS